MKRLVIERILKFVLEDDSLLFSHCNKPLNLNRSSLVLLPGYIPFFSSFQIYLIMFEKRVESDFFLKTVQDGS